MQTVSVSLCIKCAKEEFVSHTHTHTDVQKAQDLRLSSVCPHSQPQKLPVKPEW